MRGERMIWVWIPHPGAVSTTAMSVVILRCAYARECFQFEVADDTDAIMGKRGVEDLDFGKGAIEARGRDCILLRKIP
jgi:hypothetical protein